MKFFVVALLVGCAFADEVDPVNQARAMMANRILTADPSTFIDCRADPAGACGSKPGWKCQDLMKLCSPGNAPNTEAVEGDCDATNIESDKCRPLYRCGSNKKCNFVGPRACNDINDCTKEVSGVSFECKELKSNAPGNRCWMKCSNDHECHGCKSDGASCRVPENFRKHISCVQGLCQRKSAATA
ncbi:hypothetical protein RvY_05618 [Ramazzottius varieornatus]|uniref:SRCR domain-containing protein n=1 Tax=Ramazzottius varieornatus TaxID=947166 RepID=A0A1D1UVN0_RAMVA|nr:hypothetical protein RvY_05618 [Ramazzottius varieornatus]